MSTCPLFPQFFFHVPNRLGESASPKQKIPKLEIFNVGGFSLDAVFFLGVSTMAVAVAVMALFFVQGRMFGSSHGYCMDHLISFFLLL